LDCDAVPIRAEHRQFYLKPWREFRLQLIKEHGSICMKCGRFHDRINGAHQTHDPRDSRHVVLWCPSCHATHDAGHRIAIMRRNRAKAAGQLWLMPEMEWAPFAAWEIPGRIYDRLAQLNLF